MHRALPTLICGVLLLAAHAEAASRPTLHATRVSPLTVAGARFPHGQWIRIWASLGAGTQTRFVRTSATGTFRTTFAMRVVPCRTVAFVAAREVGSPRILAQLTLAPHNCR